MIDVDDPDIVDIDFAGDSAQFIYILTKNNLYKLTGTIDMEFTKTELIFKKWFISEDIVFSFKSLKFSFNNKVC